MTSSKPSPRLVAFNITGTREEVDRKIQHILAIVESNDYREIDRSQRRILTEDQPRRIHNPRPIPGVRESRESGWPLLKDKPEPPPAARKPTAVMLYGKATPVISPRTAAYFTAAVGVAGIVTALVAPTGWHLFLCGYVIVGVWFLCWVTNMQARWIQRDQETYLQQLSEAEARDVDAHNPHDLR